MKILNDIIDQLDNKSHPVKYVCCGAYWTCVTSVYSGLSTTYREHDQHHNDKPCMVKDPGTLTDLTVGELSQYATQENTVATSIGMATINSALEFNESACTEQNAADLLIERAEGAKIAIIGHFPFARRLEPLAKELWIIERKNVPGVWPESKAAEILPQCDIVCLTGTSLLNHSFERLIKLCEHAFVVLTGPTSPLTPILFDYGVDVVSGARVDNPARVNQFITEGATFRQVKRQGVKLLSMSKDSYSA